MAAEPPKTTSSADSYIGSLISLTSKSEIRYEGILYSIDTDESSIGLRNVRSFGTEGRKKDGLPQAIKCMNIYFSVVVTLRYAYAKCQCKTAFAIKDLQVKSSPPVATSSSSSIDNDPAIIQSHYPRPAATSNNLPSAAVPSTTDANSHVPQLGHPGSTFPGPIPLYQPGGNFGSWGPSPPPGANGSGLAMPMYWPGYYGPPGGLPQMPQQNLFRPPHGLSVPPSLQQQVQYSGFNPALSTSAANLTGTKLPELPPSLVTSSSSSTTLPSMPFPHLNLPPVPSTNLAPASNSVAPKAQNTGLLSTPMFPSISPLGISAPDSSTIVSAASNKVNAVSSSGVAGLTISQANASSISSSAPSQIEIQTPSLVTPDQLVQPAQLPFSSASSKDGHKDVEVIQVSSPTTPEPKVEVVKEAQPPILPLPPATRAFNKPNGATTYQPRHNYNQRGRGKGSGSGSSRGVTKFTEEFDFMAMNEKFNKDEVWGHLGKSNKSHSIEGGSAINGGESLEEEGEEELPQTEAKPVYNKDDFFDSLSCNTLDRDSQNGRTRFSEQLKIDAETFGEFARYRGGRGPGRGYRGRGGYYGRGYGGQYGYNGRGRGRGMSARG